MSGARSRTKTGASAPARRDDVDAAAEPRPVAGDAEERALLEEIEQAALPAAERVHDRVAVRAKVVLRPGNASQSRTLRVQGVTGDISEGGCRALFPLPIGVGDIFRLEIALEGIDSPFVLARCLRCRMVREDIFESGFEFLQPIHLGGEAPRGTPDLLD